MTIRYNIIFSLLASIVFLAACNLERDIEVDLPPYEPELVAECYLEPGKPYRLLLTETLPLESLSNFANLDSFPVIDDATVVITYKGVSDTLVNFPFFDPATSKLYNYVYPFNVVPADYESEFHLEITDSKGRIMTATTSILPPVPVDSLTYTFDSDGEFAAVFTWFQDNGDQENYYRRVFHESTLTSDPEQSFSVDDRFLNGETVVFGTGFEYEIGDTLIASIYHIDRAYYDYLETQSAAASSNGNPFAQPAQVNDNIEGGRGIFTGLSYDIDTLIINE